MQPTLAVAVLTTLVASVAYGDTSPSSKSRMDLFESQTRLLDGRLSEQYEFSNRLRPQPELEIIPIWRGSYRGPYLDLARVAARRHNVPEDLFLRLIERESRWNAEAVSSKGAIGLAQLMPDTATLMNVDIADPAQNLEGGARFLRRQFERFGTWRLALAAYNAGPESVEAHNDVPPFPETEAYVRAILGR